MTFPELGLNANILKAIGELGYEEPTPIQARTIAKLLEGVDVIAQAQTGTGKTAAFSLPIIERIDTSLKKPQALILTPTRELAVQVAEALHSYSKYSGLSVLPVYGGQPIDRQLRALDRGVHVVVGTPGRLLDHIQRGTLKLDSIRMLVMDEADEMLDMGFIDDIEAILKETPPERQTALFSATIPGPIAALAKNYMHNPERIVVKTAQMTVSQVRQVYYEVGGRDKFEMLARILDFEQPTSAIIFCRTKSEVDSLGERLIARAIPAETLHGDLSQIQRDRVMGRFRSNQVEVLVATDVAARGLDIEHVSHVINYDMPLDPEIYVHRIGRTGRAGRSGTAITLVTPRERRLLRIIERATSAPIQRMRLPTIADVIARRRESFKETLRETLANGGLETYTIMAEELGEEYSPTDLAAAAFKLLLGMPQDEGEDRLAAMEPSDEDRSRRGNNGDRGGYNDRGNDRGGYRGERSGGGYGGDRGGGGFRGERPGGERDFGGDRNSFGPERGMVRLFIDIGREDGVRPGDIVGAIANEANIPGRAIGNIELFDRFSFVEVPEATAERVMRALKYTTIRGRKIAPSTAKPRR
ncbi:MAG: DEAD/DEAH box helicase [Roseiflexaceae bacterium]|nr:DEAD/DEAH box helicase [Roseiflexaceae bacterium]